LQQYLGSHWDQDHLPDPCLNLSYLQITVLSETSQ
jgi:hypothetical protein